MTAEIVTLSFESRRRYLDEKKKTFHSSVVVLRSRVDMHIILILLMLR